MKWKSEAGFWKVPVSGILIDFFLFFLEQMSDGAAQDWLKELEVCGAFGRGYLI